ncbi:hypothetical protein OK074_4051 [Actinobacteria bacterium OK074]|nr:hypothetical protein OK074_4051 [Actinobacteria bacterium OK074]
MDVSVDPPASLRKLAPPPALCGFLLLLAALFTVAYGVGGAVGPVAPGMHGSSAVKPSGGGGGTGTTDSGDTGGMGGMGDGMDMGQHGGGGQ